MGETAYRFEWERLFREYMMQAPEEAVPPDAYGVAVALVMAGYADGYGKGNGGNIRPSQQTVATVCGCSTNTVRTRLSELVALGILVVTEPGRKGRQATYRLGQRDEFRYALRDELGELSGQRIGGFTSAFLEGNLLTGCVSDSSATYARGEQVEDTNLLTGCVPPTHPRVETYSRDAHNHNTITIPEGTPSGVPSWRDLSQSDYDDAVDALMAELAALPRGKVNVGSWGNRNRERIRALGLENVTGPKDTSPRLVEFRDAYDKAFHA